MVKKIDTLRILKNGLMTGFILQFAIGPVFLFIINLTLQKTLFDGLAGALGLTLADYFYIILSIFGISKFLEKKKYKKYFGIISSLALIIFGIFTIKSITNEVIIPNEEVKSINLFSSFISVFFLTLSNPMTIFFNTSLLTAKAIEYNYTKKELYLFGLSIGFGIIIFMGLAVIITNLFRGIIPITLIQILNLIIGGVLIGYGSLRMVKILKKS